MFIAWQCITNFFGMKLVLVKILVISYRCKDNFCLFIHKLIKETVRNISLSQWDMQGRARAASFSFFPSLLGPPTNQKKCQKYSFPYPTWGKKHISKMILFFDLVIGCNEKDLMWLDHMHGQYPTVLTNRVYPQNRTNSDTFWRGQDLSV